MANHTRHCRKSNAGHNRPAAVNAHSILVNEILVLCGSRADCRVWKNTTGAMQGADGQYLRFGMPGSPDIIGFTSDGRFLGIECKTGTGKLTDKQKVFENISWMFGARYFEARCAQSVAEYLDKLNLQKIDLSKI